MTLVPGSIDNLLQIDITGIDTTRANLGSLYPEARRLGVKHADDWIIDALLRVEDEVPYTYVSWDSIGGFVSDKQRRFVMAMIEAGEFTPGQDTRTGRFPKSFQRVGSPPDEKVASTSPYGPWVMGVGEQARMHIMQNWPDVVEWLSRHEDQIRSSFEEGVQVAVQNFNEMMISGGFGL